MSHLGAMRQPSLCPVVPSTAEAFEKLPGTSTGSNLKVEEQITVKGDNVSQTGQQHFAMVAPTNDPGVTKDALKTINQWEDDDHAVLTAVVENKITPNNILAMSMDSFDELKCTPEGQTTKKN